MERPTPPPFQAPPPPQARATNSANRTCLIIVLVILTLCCIGGLVVFSFMKNFLGQAGQAMGCMSTFNMAGAAAEAYAVEHGGKLPEAATWQDDIQPYYQRLFDKYKAEFEGADKFIDGLLPSAAGDVFQCKNSDRTTGVAYNSDIAGKVLKDIKDPDRTVMFFETDTMGRNQAMAYKAMPNSKAPKWMNSSRDWIVWNVSGNSNPFETSSGGSRIEIRPDDALTPDKAGK